MKTIYKKIYNTINLKHLSFFVYYSILLTSVVLFFIDRFYFLISLSVFLLILISNNFFKFSPFELISISGVSYLSIIGSLGAYNIFFYDKVVHLLTIFFITLIILNRLDIEKEYKYFFGILIAMGVSASWEIYEYFYDTIFYGQMQGVYRHGNQLLDKLDDTMFDIVFGGIGSFLATISKMFSLYLKEGREK